MHKCQVCQREFKALKFETDDIHVCTRCVNSLNKLSEPAVLAEKRLAEKLAASMMRKALADVASDDPDRQAKGRWKLDNFDLAVARALPWWLNKILADQNNTTKDFKMLRAHRRGLLRYEGEIPFPPPHETSATKRAVRRRDGLKCMACGIADAPLDVHHIIYLSNLGTNQKPNLIALCRSCHEKEHGRVFDAVEQALSEKEQMTERPSADALQEYKKLFDEWRLEVRGEPKSVVNQSTPQPIVESEKDNENSTQQQINEEGTTRESNDDVYRIVERIVVLSLLSCGAISYVYVAVYLANNIR